MNEPAYCKVNAKYLNDLIRAIDPQGFKRVQLLACIQEMARLHGGYIYATAEKLSEGTGINKRTVQRWMAFFEKNKLIKRVAPGIWQYIDTELPRMIDVMRY